MECPLCKTDNPETSKFCGSCGNDLAPPTAGELSLRILKLEQLSKASEERLVEYDLTEKIAERLLKWAKYFAFAAGIPLSILAFCLALFFGKTFKDLQDLAKNANEAVRPIMDKAKREAASAEAVASEALAKAQVVHEGVQATQRSIADLQRNTEQQAKAASALAGQLQDATGKVGALQAQLNIGQQKIESLNLSLTRADTNKTTAELEDIYPNTGERVGGTRAGFIDLAKKTAGDVYVDVMLSVQQGNVPTVKPSEAGVFIEKLKKENYRVLLGPLGLWSTTGRVSSGVWQIDGTQICLMTTKSHRPPCVIYFHPELQEKAKQIAALAQGTQTIASEQVAYSDPKTWGNSPPYEETIRKSGVDIVVVLGSR